MLNNILKNCSLLVLLCSTLFVDHSMAMDESAEPENNNSAQQSNFVKLPKDIAREVFREVAKDINEVYNARLVCKEWSGIIDEDTVIWKTYFKSIGYGNLEAGSKFYKASSASRHKLNYKELNYKDV